MGIHEQKGSTSGAAVPLFFCDQSGSMSGSLQSLVTPKISPSVPQLELLTRFIEKGVLQNHLGHVVWGSKPMVMVGVVDPSEMERKVREAILKAIPNGSEHEIMREEMAVAIEFLPRYLSSKFVFKYYPGTDSFMQSPSKGTFIFLDRAKVESVVLGNREIFSRVLFDEMTPERLLQRLIVSSTLEEALAGRDELLGMLLGFGTQNSLDYAFMNDKKRATGVPIAKPDNWKVFSAQPGPGRTTGPKVLCPGFAGDLASAETKSITRNFIRDTEAVQALVDSGVVVQRFLNAMSNGNWPF